MVRKKMKICKNIIKYKKLGKILQKSHIPDYLSLQEEFEPGALDFSDYEFENDTIVYMTDDLLEEYEEQKDATFYRRGPFIISIISLIMSVFALLATIGSESVLWTTILKLLQK